MNPFLTWLLGVGSIAVGVYVGLACPETACQFVGMNVGIGFAAAVVGGACLASIVPTKLLGLPAEAARGIALGTLVFAGIAQMLHPQWLSGDAFGWNSMVIAGLLMVCVFGAVLKLLKIW